MTKLSVDRQAPYRFAPGARVLWRSVDSVQIELAGRSVLVEGIDADLAERLGLRLPGADRSGSGRKMSAGRADAGPLDAGPAEPEPLDAGPLDAGPAEPEPLDAGSLDADTPAARIARMLADAGLIWNRHKRDTDPDLSGPDAADPRLISPVPRLAGELAALSAVHGEAAADVLHTRRHATVVIHGRSRVGVHLAALLAAAGVGHVHVAGGGDVRLAHVQPGGARPADEGSALGPVADAAIRAAAPECDPGPPRPEQRPDLIVLATDQPVDPERRRALHHRRLAHLVVSVDLDGGAIGPLVIPGFTACARCADLHRTDRDPAWPTLAVQLSVPRHAARAVGAAAATTVVGVAALQALDFLDGGRPAAIDGTIELHTPDWRLRRRSWPPHPSCDCMEADTS